MMPKTDAEKDALIALVMQYEACYEEIVNYVESANNDDTVGIPEMYEHVMSHLDATFGSKETADHPKDCRKGDAP
jgi:hypothetical protein